MIGELTQVAAGNSLYSVQNMMDEYFEPGEAVVMDVGLDALPTAQEIADLDGYLRSSGLQLLSSPQAIETPGWPGAIRLKFRRPVVPDSEDKYSLWPVLLLGVLAVGGMGYVLWKGGEITEDAVNRAMNIAFPVILVSLAAWVGVKYIESQKAT